MTRPPGEEDSLCLSLAVLLCEDVEGVTDGASKDGSSSGEERPWLISSSMGERAPLWTSFSLQFLHFILRFWNQIFTYIYTGMMERH